MKENTKFYFDGENLRNFEIYPYFGSECSLAVSFIFQINSNIPIRHTLLKGFLFFKKSSHVIYGREKHCN